MAIVITIIGVTIGKDHNLVDSGRDSRSRQSYERGNNRKFHCKSNNQLMMIDGPTELID